MGITEETGPMEEGEPLAVEVEDLLYGETDDACAICGTRGSEWLTVHHIDGNDSNNIYENMIVLCNNCHIQYHQEKGLEAKTIEDRKRHLITKTLTQYGLNALKIADRNKVGIMATPFLVFHLVGLGFLKRVGGEAVMSWITAKGEETVEIEGDVQFAITERGSELLRHWFS